VTTHTRACSRPSSSPLLPSVSPAPASNLTSSATTGSLLISAGSTGRAEVLPVIGCEQPQSVHACSAMQRRIARRCTCDACVADATLWVVRNR
jgi:hypothetical protein